MKTILLLLCFGLLSRAGTLVVPNGLDNVEGDTSAIGLFGGDQQRTQVIYGYQQFSLFPAEGAYITELQFRMEGTHLSGFSAGADLEVHLSTTQRGGESLSPVFAANVGADDQVVLPRTILQLHSDAVPGGPNSFSVVIPLPNKFYYSPANGSLLMDAFVYSAAAVPNLDWKLGSSDGVSAAVGPVNGQLASVVSNSGLVTRFVFEPIPEPSTVLLIFPAALLILITRRKHVCLTD